MTLVPAPKREPFQFPPREPLPEVDAAPESQPSPAVDVAVVADVSALDQVVSEQAVLESPATASPEWVDMSAEAAAAADGTPTTETAPNADSPTRPPPDEFGAGLGDVSPDPAP